MPVSKKPRKHHLPRPAECVGVDRNLLATRCWMALQILTEQHGFTNDHYERLGMALNISGRLVNDESEMALLQSAAAQMLDMRHRYEQTRAWQIDPAGEGTLTRALALCDDIWERSTPQQLYHVYCQLTNKLRRATANAGT